MKREELGTSASDRDVHTSGALSPLCQAVHLNEPKHLEGTGLDVLRVFTTTRHSTEGAATPAPGDHCCLSQAGAADSQVPAHKHV